MLTWSSRAQLLPWVAALHVLVLMIGYLTVEAMQFSVELRMPRYVPYGGSAQLRCEYSVHRETLHKVEWLRGHHKLFQFVKGRKPPFRHYAISGAVVDRNHSNERQITLRGLDFDATGYYSCEVSTQTPIFTKASNEEELTVIQQQRSAPELTVRRPLYTVGEVLEANCTSSPARPVPHVTWLVNGDKASESLLRFFPSQQLHEFERLSASTVQLSLVVTEEHIGPDERLHLACITTIPAFMGPGSELGQYADYRTQEASVEVLRPPLPSGVGAIQLHLLCILPQLVAFLNCR